MGFFDNFTEIAKQITDKVGEKTGDLVELAKLKHEISTTNAAIRKCYEKLGLAVYEMKKNGETDSELITETINEIDGLKIQLTEIKAMIEAQKNASSEFE